MPRRDDLYTNEIQNRYATLEEAGKTALTPEQLSVLQNSQRQLFDELGIVVSDNWNISSEGLVPRFFVLAPDKEYHDSILPLASVDIKPGSPEFWKEVQLGNIFAYPLGSEDPVQLQLKQKNGQAKLSYSEPVNASNLPDPPVKPVKWYHRVAHFFTGGRAFDEMIKKFDNLEEDRETRCNKIGGMQESRKFAFEVENERHQRRADEIAKEERELAEKKRTAEANNYAESAENSHGRLNRSLEQATSVLQPVPQFDPSIEKRAKVREGDKAEGLYTKEQFANLEVYGKDQIDLSKINVGESGKTVTNEEFAAVAFFGLWDPKNALVMYNKQQPDIWAEKSLSEMGYNKEQAGVLLTAQLRNFWSSDLFIVPPRDNEGSYFKDITNLGRKDALEAFQAYRDGDNTKLANMIAKGVNMAGGDLGTVDKADDLTDQQKAAIVMTSKIIDLMKNDPKLEAKATELGMDPEMLRAAKGMAEFARILQDREEAEYKMSQAVKNGEELPEQEKKACTIAMLKGRMAQQMLYSDNASKAQVIDEKATELGKKMIECNTFDMQKWVEDPSSRPEPPKGRIYSDTVTKIIPSMAKTEISPSESMRQLGDEGGVKQMDMIADQIYKQNEFSKVSTRELFRSLNEHNSATEFKTAENIVSATNELIKQAEEAKNNGPDKNLENNLDKNLENNIEKKNTIKERAQMFEMKV